MHRLPRSLTLRQQPSLIRRPSVRIPRAQTRSKSTRVYYTSDGEPIRLQSVRLLKPGIFTLKKIATFGLYTGIVCGYVHLLWRYMDIEIEFLEDDEDEEKQNGETKVEGGEAEKEEEEEEDGPPFYADEASTFIPLTWSTQLPRTFYKGSDPEWQEFIKIAKDKGRHKKVQNELVAVLFTGTSNHPTIARQLGKDIKVGKYWLDISFPDGPPQEYERSGIEIGDGFVAWSQQRVSEEKQWRLMRALWPKATANSSWATIKVLGGIQWRRFKQAMGWEGVDPAAPEERFRAVTEFMKKEKDSQQSKDPLGKTQTDPKGPPSEVVRRSDAASTSTSTPSSTPAQPSNRQPQPDQAQESNWLLPTVPIPTLPRVSSLTKPKSPSSSSDSDNPPANLDIPIAMHVFQSTLSRSWNPKKVEPPRGTFVVQGLVEIRGARGKMLFDVQGAYDPKVGKFVHINAGVRNFKMWSQRPRGGN